MAFVVLTGYKNVTTYSQRSAARHTKHVELNLHFKRLFMGVEGPITR